MSIAINVDFMLYLQSSDLAEVVELVDTPSWGGGGASRAGSSPADGTNNVEFLQWAWGVTIDQKWQYLSPMFLCGEIFSSHWPR